MRFVKIGPLELVFWTSQAKGGIFLDFLVEEPSGGCDFRILRVSISLGTKFQQIRLRRIEARACLRKGVDVSAISSMQTVWRGRSRLADRGVTLLFLASTELLRCKIFESHATGCAGDTGTWVAIVGPTSPWVFEPSTTTPKLTTTQP